jgi:hypothetical protein
LSERGQKVSGVGRCTLQERRPFRLEFVIARHCRKVKERHDLLEVLAVNGSPRPLGFCPFLKDFPKIAVRVEADNTAEVAQGFAEFPCDG